MIHNTLVPLHVRALIYSERQIAFTKNCLRALRQRIAIRIFPETRKKAEIPAICAVSQKR